MFGRRITLFTLFGFPIRLDSSWIFMAALIVWSLASGVFPNQVPGLSPSHYWWMGVVGALGLFASIVAHELCHSLVARYYSLPMRGITLFIFGGVAEMSGEPQSAKVEFLMAIAGPAASIVFGFLFHLLMLAGRDSWPRQVTGILQYLSWINLALAAFNMIPAFPLDGGRVLRSLLWRIQGNLESATRIASRFGVGFGVLMMLLGAYELVGGFVIAGVWYVLIGMFVQAASRAAYDQVRRRAEFDADVPGRPPLPHGLGPA